MEKQEHRTKKDQRVVIKDTATHMYDWARVYNEGWVRRQQHDHLGYPLIYVEWDKNHWAYSGEQDRWVLEAHFDPVEEDMADEKKIEFDAFLQKLSELVAAHQNAKPEGENEPQSEPVEDELKQKDVELTYEYVLQKGLEQALKGEAYLLFVAATHELRGEQITIPLLFMHSKDEPSRLLVDAAAADHVSRSLLQLSQEVAKDHDEPTQP